MEYKNIQAAALLSNVSSNIHFKFNPIHQTNATNTPTDTTTLYIMGLFHHPRAAQHMACYAPTRHGHHTPVSTGTHNTHHMHAPHTAMGTIPAAPAIHHQKRKTTIGDKISGAMLKLKGTLTHHPGQKVCHCSAY
jgi:hypothetical protein